MVQSEKYRVEVLSRRRLLTESIKIVLCVRILVSNTG